MLLAAASIVGLAACVLDTAGTDVDTPGSGAASSTASSGGAGGSAAEGGSGGGEQTPCVPGTRVACYGGEDATRNVGACHDGERECNPKGTGYGPCVGDQLPRTEDCGTPDDESCDTLVGCTGTVSVVFDFGENDDIDGFGLATVGDDAVVACGVSGAWLSQPCQDFDVGIGRFDLDKSEVFSGRFGGAGRQVATGVTRDAGNRLWMTGFFDPDLDFGDGPLADDGNTNTQNIWVARFDSSGSYQWSAGFGAADVDDEASAIAAGIEEADGVVVVGSFRGLLDLGGAFQLQDTGNGGDVFVARFDADGTVGAAKRFGDASYQHATSVARFYGGDLAVAGFYEGTIDFGGGELPAANYRSAFVARLDREGAHVWSRGFGGAGEDVVDGVAAAPDGGTVVVGSFENPGDIELGGACGMVEGVQSGHDAYAIKFDAGGDCVWAHRWGDLGDARAHGVAVDGAGQVIVTGEFNDGMTVGDEVHDSFGYNDAFVLKLGADGEPIWSRSFGDAADEQRGYRVGALESGEIWLLGKYGGTIVIDGKGLTTPDDNHAFLMRIAP
ncbi:MAG: hypothetical protein WKG00_11815 [Polyangiaceae bacterium]